MGIKSERRLCSSDEEKQAAFVRAVKVLRGTSHTLNKSSIAMQASRYLPDKPSMVRKALYEMSEEQFAALIALQGEAVGDSNPPLPKEALRPERPTHWVFGRKRTPAQQID